MAHKFLMKPLAIALGAAFATGLPATSEAGIADNLFAMTSLSSGYMVASADGKPAASEKAEVEGKRGGEKEAAPEGKCGEGKCGGEKKPVFFF